jgi:hypothetical protein
MFILEILLGLKSMQGDVTCAFLCTDLKENETVYVDMPMGFAQYGKNGKKQCLKLKKTLYGLQQSPRAFWKCNYLLIEAFSPSSNILTCTLHPVYPFHSDFLPASLYHLDHPHIQPTPSN